MFNQSKNAGARRDQLFSDADFEEEALRLLPEVAKQQAEELWKITKQQLKLSSTQKAAFLNEMMRPYKIRCSSESRALLTAIEATLRKRRFSSPCFGTNQVRGSKFHGHKF